MSELSRVVIPLLKGVLYQEQDVALWSQLLSLQTSVRDYVKVLGLELFLDEAEGYAFVKQRPPAEDEEPLPRLVVKRQLNYSLSLLIALLRRKLVELDRAGGSTRLVLSRDEIAELVRLFQSEGSNDARRVDRVEAALNKLVDMGFVKKLKDQQFEVRRILKAFVDAQWLDELDARLAAYAEA